MVKLIAATAKPLILTRSTGIITTCTSHLSGNTRTSKLEITKITGAPIGESKYHVMAEMYYDTIDAMNAAKRISGGPRRRQKT